MAIFPSAEWVQALHEKLNSDARYAEIARNWEGDMICEVEQSAGLDQSILYYLDLWHGQCRRVEVISDSSSAKAAFRLKAPYENYVRLLKGELEPMQALLTRKIGVQGNMAVLMRSVPTVLDFVRCCREITDGYI